MRRMLGLPARIALVVAAGAVLVALGVTLLLVNTVKLHHSADATTRSDAYLAAVINLERTVVDAETGLRGYVITGRLLFLDPTRQARRTYPGAAAALVRAAAADGAFSAQVAALEHSADAYMNGYLPRTITLATRDRAAAGTYAVTLQGQRG